ncbi:hypothetical protein PINS_up022444 [Pythium insidiosum]|nr:hypothetical protein PINS_up022444 [Pythium insidiosum]
MHRRDSLRAFVCVCCCACSHRDGAATALDASATSPRARVSPRPGAGTRVHGLAAAGSSQTRERRGHGAAAAVCVQGIASRQQHAKRKAEVENAQLRELVEAQLRLLQSLERLLHKRPTLLTSFLDASESQAHKRARLERETRASESDTATSVFEILRLGLVTHLADVDAAFAGITTSPVDSTDCQAKSDGDDRVFIELRQVKHFPFPLDATARAVWQCLCAPHHDLDGSTYQAVVTDDDTCNAQLEMSLPLRRAHVSVQLDCAGQRRVEMQRTVIVFDSFWSRGESVAAWTSD